ALFTVYLAEALLLASSAERARPLAARALELSRTQHRRGFEAWALRLHGSLASHDHDPATAVAYYCEALDLSTTLGARPVVARCRFDLGALYRRTGDESAAREHLEAAARL